MILICYGTRPEYIKVKSLIDNLTKGTFRVLFTGQHLDLVKPEEKVDHTLTITTTTTNRLNNIMSNILSSTDATLFHNIEYVLVQGDTTSALAMAISAFNHGIKVMHLEAGLRTYNLSHPYPEEMNRQLISRIAAIHLCPTTLNRDNLVKENIDRSKIFVVGNTGLDNIRKLLSVSSSFTPALSLNPTSLPTNVIVTLHRRENLPIMDKWYEEIIRVATKYGDQLDQEEDRLKFTIIFHPNPEIKAYKSMFVEESNNKYNNITILDAVSHEELIWMMNECRFIITDSGGIQEEASFLKKRLIVCRETTERVELLGNYVTLAKTPADLGGLIDQLYHNYKMDLECPYGDGQSWLEIQQILRYL